MTGILVVTHGDFGIAMLKAAEMILGPQGSVKALGLALDTPREDLAQGISKVLKELDQGQGVLILADFFGGTPCNASLGFCLDANVELVAGLSLPLLMEALLNRAGMKLPDLAEWVQKKGQEGVILVSRQAREIARKAGS